MALFVLYTLLANILKFVTAAVYPSKSASRITAAAVPSLTTADY